MLISGNSIFSATCIIVFEILTKNVFRHLCSTFSNRGHLSPLIITLGTHLQLDTQSLKKNWWSGFRGEHFFKGYNGRLMMKNGSQVMAKAYLDLKVKTGNSHQYQMYIFICILYFVIPFHCLIHTDFGFFSSVFWTGDFLHSPIHHFFSSCYPHLTPDHT